MSELYTILLLIGAGYIFGNIGERRHFRSLRAREAETLRIPTIDIDVVDPARVVVEARLVCGQVTLAVDYFRRFAGSIRNFFGGQMAAYESLLDRARREAILRMKAEAPDCDIVVNVHIDASPIGKEKSKGRFKVTALECIASGTAIRYAQK